jgi:translation initiation factor IF-1
MSAPETIDAEITALLPQLLFRLQATDGTQIVATPSPEAKRLGRVLKLGDRVSVRRARLDPARGTILGPANPPGARGPGPAPSKNGRSGG